MCNIDIQFRCATGNLQSEYKHLVSMICDDYKLTGFNSDGVFFVLDDADKRRKDINEQQDKVKELMEQVNRLRILTGRNDER